MSIRYQLTIEGMSCSNCEKHVREILLNFDGVSGVRVSAPNSKATFESDEELSHEELEEVLDDEGYILTEVVAR